VAVPPPVAPPPPPSRVSSTTTGSSASSSTISPVNQPAVINVTDDINAITFAPMQSTIPSARPGRIGASALPGHVTVIKPTPSLAHNINRFKRECETSTYNNEWFGHKVIHFV
jgi:hypothetical protein